MSVSSNGTPALVNVASPSNAMTVTGTFPTGSSPAVNHLIVCVVTCTAPPPRHDVAQHTGTAGTPTLHDHRHELPASIWTKTATGSDSRRRSTAPPPAPPATRT